MDKISGKVLDRNIYADGEYLRRNPTWHSDESEFKVGQINLMLKKHRLSPGTICEVGCGAGEVLRLLQKSMEAGRQFHGYDISPQAIALCQDKSNENLRFTLADISQEEGAYFDLMLVLDVVEHVEDYYGFLARIRPKSDLKIFHFPLDLSAQAVARRRGLLTRRERYGHLQYFTCETSLETLKDTGYELLDWFYTPRCIALAKELIQKIAILPRKLCFALAPDLAVRVLGGYSLLVLAR